MTVKQTSLYITEDLLKKLKIIAIKEDKKVNSIILSLVDSYVEDYFKNKK